MNVSLNTPKLNFVCGSAIYPSRFVKVSASADYQCLPCTASDTPDGISQEGGRYPPVTGATGVAGDTNDPLAVYAVQQTCILELGSTVTRGSLVGPDSAGKGIPALTGQTYGAVALESGVSGNKIRVEIIIGQLN